MLRYDLFEYALQEEENAKMSEKAEKPLTIEIYEKRIGMLDWNFEELNRGLDERLKSYTDVQYTDDQIQLAKKDRANLNGFKKAVNDRKIELKKEFCEPYDNFADQVKQLIGKVDKAVQGIDQQIKAYEQREKDEKKNRIISWWKTNGPKLYAVDLEQVFDPKYLNKSCSDSTWQKELAERAEQIDRDLDTILKYVSDTKKYEFCSMTYLKTLDLGQTMAAWERHKEETARAEELAKRREEELQAAAEEAAEIPQVQNDHPAVRIYTRTMRVQGTREQIIILADFMKKNGIKFWKVEGGR